MPVYVELPADLITPCMAYLRIAKDSRYSFLLESVIAGENIARYSFIGAGGFCISEVYKSLKMFTLLRSLEGHQDWS